MAIQWGNNLQPMKVYHGSSADFNDIDINKAKGDSAYSKGVYVADDDEMVNEYGDNKYEFDFTPKSIGDIEGFEFTPEHIEKIASYVKQPYFGYKSEDEIGKNKELEEEREDVRGQFTKDGWLSGTFDNKRALAKFRLHQLGRLAHDNNMTLSELLKSIGVGEFDAVKIPIENNVDKNYYVVFDPKTLKMTRKYKK